VPADSPAHGADGLQVSPGCAAEERAGRWAAAGGAAARRFSRAAPAAPPERSRRARRRRGCLSLVTRPPRPCRHAAHVDAVLGGERARPVRRTWLRALAVGRRRAGAASARPASARRESALDAAAPRRRRPASAAARGFRGRSRRALRRDEASLVRPHGSPPSRRGSAGAPPRPARHLRVHLVGRISSSGS